MIKTENEQTKYFDRNGKEIIEGCKIRCASGRIEEIYRTITDELGTDATNKHWVKTGRAIPCEYGVYPLTIEETEEVEVVD